MCNKTNPYRNREARNKLEHIGTFIEGPRYDRNGVSRISGPHKPHQNTYCASVCSHATVLCGGRPLLDAKTHEKPQEEEMATGMFPCIFGTTPNV
jgi:hypothetical protein